VQERSFINSHHDLEPRYHWTSGPYHLEKEVCMMAKKKAAKKPAAKKAAKKTSKKK
jgi:hypothetical protein